MEWSTLVSAASQCWAILLRVAIFRSMTYPIVCRNEVNQGRLYLCFTGLKAR